MKSKIVIAKNDSCQNCAEGVMLRHSKHVGNGLPAPILREPQDDSALLRNALLAIFFCAFTAVNVLGQGKDTSTQVKPLDSVVDKDVLYVIDGVPSKDKLDGINPNDILSIDILKKGKSLDNTSLTPVRDVVIVVTRVGAIKTYQKKLSSFSKRYKEYIDAHNGDDSDLIYLVDGVQVSANRDERTRILHDLKGSSIRNIVFTHDMGADSSSVPVVSITTK